MKIGIMGGTFNPVHNAHLLIAEIACEQYELDRVIFMTGGNPPHKSDAIDAHDRLNMARIAIEGNSHFIADDFEVERSEKSYTLHTLEYLKKKYPSAELFFIIGEDSLCDLHKWYKPEEILKLCTILVFPRKSQKETENAIMNAKNTLGGNILPVTAPVIGISSTDIRSRIKNKQTVRYMLPEGVIRYIEENGLYV